MLKIDEKGNGWTRLALKVGAWTVAIIGSATILSWLYAFLVMQPVLAAVQEERMARVFSDSLMIGRLEILALNQAQVTRLLLRERNR